MAMPPSHTVSNNIYNYRAISLCKTKHRRKGITIPIFAMREELANRKANAVITCKNANHLCRISPLCIVIIILPQQLRLKYAVIDFVKRLSVSSNCCGQKPQQCIRIGQMLCATLIKARPMLCAIALWISFQAYISRPCRERRN